MKPRGQNMMLFALTLMLLALMVTMTLSFATRAKQKMELQTLADAAAYSNAVVTARTYNAVAAIHRAQLGHYVAQAGTQSQISWAGHYWGSINTAVIVYYWAWDSWYRRADYCCETDPVTGDYEHACSTYCSCLTNGSNNLAQMTIDLWFNELKRIRNVFYALDAAAGAQSRDLQTASWMLFGQHVGAVEDLRGQLEKQLLAETLLSRAGAPGVKVTKDDIPELTLREVFDDGIATAPQDWGNSVHAAMGSRGHPFTTSRDQGETYFNDRFLQLVSPPDILRASGSLGSGYWDGAETHAAASANGTMSWADDHENLTVRYERTNPCDEANVWRGGTFALGPNNPWGAYVKSTWEQDRQDLHKWAYEGYSDDPWGMESDPPGIHTMGPTDDIEHPGVWFGFTDYRLTSLADPSNMFGQPKNYVGLTKDLGASNDPWNLAFRFRFTSQGESFDNRGLQARAVLPGGSRVPIDIDEQAVLATGVAYYHRAVHWKEPPNLFNPFWRAGLIHANPDRTWQSDIRRATGDMNPAARDAFQSLVGAGFQGWQ